MKMQHYQLLVAYLLTKAYNQGYEDCNADTDKNEYYKGKGKIGFDFEKALKELFPFQVFEMRPTPSEYLVSFDKTRPFTEQVLYRMSLEDEGCFACSVPEYEQFIGNLQSNL